MKIVFYYRDREINPISRILLKQELIKIGDSFNPKIPVEILREKPLD